jgi:hypothetical protein
MLIPRKKKCSTCPFRDDKKALTCVRDLLVRRALNTATPICHSTGAEALEKKNQSKPALACRGARDLQLQFFHAAGFISEATDQAWAAKAKEMNL